MSVNGIGTAGYSLTGYTARKTESSVEPGMVGFMEKVEEKLVQAVEEARKGAFPLEDLHEMLDVLYRGEDL